MKYPKYQEFFHDLLNIRNLNTIKNFVKHTIGDSYNNNRTLTVNQIIRYASANQIRNGRKVAKRLQFVTDVLRPLVTYQRKKDGCSRTDAIDINELVAVYREIVMNQRRLRKYIGRNI